MQSILNSKFYSALFSMKQPRSCYELEKQTESYSAIYNTEGLTATFSRDQLSKTEELKSSLPDPIPHRLLKLINLVAANMKSEEGSDCCK